MILGFPSFSMAKTSPKLIQLISVISIQVMAIKKMSKNNHHKRTQWEVAMIGVRQGVTKSRKKKRKIK